MIPVIICGGIGKKLWPMSRSARPKHFLPLIGDKSLFQLNYESLRRKFKPEEIFVSTNEEQSKIARKQAPEIPQENYILEPEMRNQGPATGLVAAELFKRGFEDEPFMIIQADVLRDPAESFLQMIEDCGALAKNENKYITGGFRPEYPVMGVDYLVKGKRVSPEGKTGIYDVAKFVWRGSKEQTEDFIKQDNILVHANHTCMTPKNMLEVLKKYKPEWYEPLMNIINGADVKTEYLKMPEGPIEDVTQKVYEAGEALVVELPFKWMDFGTFESISKYLVDNGIYKEGENIVETESKDNFVLLDDPNKVVALVGVSGLVVVDTGDALLVCKKSESAKVQDALGEIKKRNLALT